MLVRERSGQLRVLRGRVRARHGAVLRTVRALHRPVARINEERRQKVQESNRQLPISMIFKLTFSDSQTTQSCRSDDPDK
ncbi:hypothetical protein MSG28_011503 [Choristoneura fumiferana]|uniref:Uncharacterized protein n=1 Tax=Choristoneura fumiferana TaxID=7141 RepID=A0ACC0JNM4_CHOFU|nr:hypothetical protein MSG28_011503 [Choristoneura fumiferana]